MRDRDQSSIPAGRAPLRFAAGVLLAIAVIGCATVPPRRGTVSPMPGSTAASAPTSPPATPAASPEPKPASAVPGTPVGTTASGGTIVTTGPSTAVIDTFPSGDAKAVLETLPEPLAAGQRVAPPKLPAGHPGITPAAGGETRTPAETEPAGAEAGEDSVRAESGASETGDVPVPSPTRPLGDRPRPATADSTAPSASPAPSAPAPAPSGAPGAPAAPARADTCWRVQVAAVPEPERAEALRSAAQSQLLVEWVIESDKGLHKVRTKGCYGVASAEGLRRRAVDAGFAGAFKFQNPAR